MFAALALILSAAPSADELEVRFAALTSDASAVRAEAQRWLTAHLRRADFPRLADAALAGDAETRLRLAHALGSDERHVALALLCLWDAEVELSRIGRRALEDLVARWCEGSEEAGVAGHALGEHLEKLARRGEPRVLRLEPTWTLGENLALLARHGELELGITADPGELGRALANPALAGGQGTWYELVSELALAAKLRPEGHGLSNPIASDAPSQGFLHLCASTSLGESSASELLVAWLARLAPTIEPDRRRAAATSLALSSWPAAIAYLAEEGLRENDSALLEGALGAASAGHVDPSLATEEVLRSLVARTEKALLAQDLVNERFAYRVLDGLARLPAVGRGGVDLSAVVFEGFESAPLRGKWLRAVLLERMGGTRGLEDPRVRALRAELARAPGASAPELARACLRALDVLGAHAHPAPVLGAPLALLSTAASEREEVELAALLARAHAVPPSIWRDPEGTPAGLSLGARRIVERWWLGLREVDAAAAHLVALVEVAWDDDVQHLGALARGLATLRESGDGELVKRVLVRAANLAQGSRAAEPLLWLRACAGEIDGATAERLFNARREMPPRIAWCLTGVLAGRGGEGVGALARSALQVGLRTLLAGEAEAPDAEILATAFEDALAGLFGADQDAAALALLGTTRQLLTRVPEHPWIAEMRERGWPAPPRRGVVRLSELDRRIPAGSL